METNKKIIIQDLDLREFKNWYLKNNIIQTPFKEPLMFIDGIAGITLYRKKPFQVQLFICEPNTTIAPPMPPIIIANKGDGIRGSAVIATRPPRAPFSI